MLQSTQNQSQSPISANINPQTNGQGVNISPNVSGQTQAFGWNPSTAFVHSQPNFGQHGQTFVNTGSQTPNNAQQVFGTLINNGQGFATFVPAATTIAHGINQQNVQPIGNNNQVIPGQIQNIVNGPAISFSETKTTFTVSAELPGVQEADIEVLLQGDTLTIRGEKQLNDIESQAVLVQSDRQQGVFQRTIQLGNLITAIDQNKVTAKMNNGVLRVNMTKNKEGQANFKKVNISNR